MRTAVARRGHAEQALRGLVEPDHATAAVEHDDAVRQRGGTFAEGAQQGDQAALARALSVQFGMHIHGDVRPHAAIFRRRQAPARTQPGLQLIEFEQRIQGVPEQGGEQGIVGDAEAPAERERDRQQDDEASQRDLPCVALQELQLHRLNKQKCGNAQL